MTNLTEKWKKGELANGTYYVRLNHDSSTIDVYDCGVWWNNAWHEITEVLEEVPSYEEWQEYKDANDSMFDVIKMLNKYNYKLEKENTKLKELLKEIRGKLHYINTPQNRHNIFGNDLMKKLDQVLGEE